MRWIAALWMILVACMTQVEAVQAEEVRAEAARAEAAQAAAPVVVIELFTSQGCSSCPPADAFLHELAGRDEVLPLSLHVDYWDYIGWKDVFAQPKFTKRQHSYAVAAKQRSVYTPQMVVMGQEQVVGNHPKDVNALIGQYVGQFGAGQARSALHLTREGDRLRIRAETRAPGPMIVELVRYSPDEHVEIRRGENAGRTLGYANVVRDWQVVGQWDGTAPLDLTVPFRPAVGDGQKTAVILQRVGKRGLGPIDAAARLD